MESKIIAILLIALLGGLGIGYGLEYTSAANTTKDVTVTNFPTLPKSVNVTNFPSFSSTINANVTNFPKATSVNVSNLPISDETMVFNQVNLNATEYLVGSPAYNAGGFGQLHIAIVCLDPSKLDQVLIQLFVAYTGTVGSGNYGPMYTINCSAVCNRFESLGLYLTSIPVPGQQFDFEADYYGLTNSASITLLFYLTWS
jgi:hypothetical protein